MQDVAARRHTERYLIIAKIYFLYRCGLQRKSRHIQTVGFTRRKTKQNKNNRCSRWKADKCLFNMSDGGCRPPFRSYVSTSALTASKSSIFMAQFVGGSLQNGSFEAFFTIRAGFRADMRPFIFNGLAGLDPTWAVTDIHVYVKFRTHRKLNTGAKDRVSPDRECMFRQASWRPSYHRVNWACSVPAPPSQGGHASQGSMQRPSHTLKYKV